MSREDWEIIIADVPDQEEPEAEVYYKNEQWVGISMEFPNTFTVKFCNKDEGNYWEFTYDEAMEILQEAKNRLAKLQRTPEEQAEYEARQKELANFNPTPEKTAEYERKMEEQRKKYYG
uniref:Uncharacterized protein n=1 Tax=Candidatus Kentrum sp. SD TaxID=2126332 RepID=A0A450YS81_9GAMM|nr:MAG: hypothetical protein BECKSD772F_GA0070984_11773 [Candidatus Kentron sp. SD]